ncbi:four helix bundle protein [Flavihumibacter sp. R14]|nr:four helix bundle protein [Flavihumibacter soli]
MKPDNVIQNKSYAFSIRIIRLYQFLVDDRREYVLSKQLLRCGTSIGANIEEAVGAQSKKDFYAKLSIAYKEARETHYWIRLLADTDYINSVMKTSLLYDVEELLKIIGSIRKSLILNSKP